MSRLILVPTPIGNLKDITQRALEVLAEVDLVLTEDTREARKLLSRYNISVTLESHHMFNEHRNVESVCERILSGVKTALITDAGTPGISDPGFLLVRECVRKGIPVETLPGPTALIPALVNSGLPSERFCFEGFLPYRKGRRRRFELLQEEERTMIFYESPYKLVKTLNEMITFFGPDREASVSREMTKIHEETVRGTLSYITDYYTDKSPKGELVIVVAGKKVKYPAH